MEESPDLPVSPMLAEDVCGILGTFNMVECEDADSNGFPDMVEGQGIVSLVEFRMQYGGAFHNRLVVSKHVGLLSDRNTKVAQGDLEIN